MGNCLGATASYCCPNSSWATAGGRGLPTQLTFDYDEIDDLEFENLLNNPHGPHGAFGSPRQSSAFWERLAALFRFRREGVVGADGVGRIVPGAFRAGGYQAVPTGVGFDEPVVRDDDLEDDEFLRHEEDAELMSNEQIRRITSFAQSQQRPVTRPPPSTTPPSKPERPEPKQALTPSKQLVDISSNEEPLSTALSDTQVTTDSDNAPLRAPRPMTTFQTFRPKRRASAAVSAAAIFSSSVDGPATEGEEEEGFGQFQTATPRQELTDPLQELPAPEVVNEQPNPISASETLNVDEEPAETEADAPGQSVTAENTEEKEPVQTDPLQAVAM
ncbi:uncharacterized protein SPPG_08393 [Spizellomyces punctatus DAOM BR117]|uniref:Uncharacterized protein n=1 Tax=Spizellomyces punctatus (strain DAOM BR117) TaxID=645134 RepID=A0A0L0H5J9_SPIPD|nr:uncharacterized protein SPPG_08393 [Spizellomyces punctatus DAOM BR117]KNC96239.1 hypothetical protein SPPG_08393 [Spizellomyces punctatus DAOM BR117]|eukprot:XP_016604279.1 hypothetical protein SPPG_08393 [Spizellomyces punctatus DAOM BR117]